MLKSVLKTVNEYLETITHLVKTLVIIGIIVEIIFQIDSELLKI